MKKTLIVTAMLMVVFSASYAQTGKGNQALGLNLAFALNNRSGVTNFGTALDAGVKTTQFSIGPNYSYFIADKLDLGASFSYSTSTSTYAPAPSGYLAKESSSNLGGIVYLRKYVMFKDLIGFRAGPYIGYNTNDAKDAYYQVSGIDTKTDYYNAGMRLELVYFPSKRLGVSTYLASLDYSHYKSDSGTFGHQTGDNLYLNVISNTLAISVSYVFGK
ncbi:MAG TPA: hypothetical protein VG367_03410 [Mucilaginibacter sp.]|jgi:hypothetical protein|nr:hypothetical protein [Mucilaginibacter sp.]